MLWHPPLTLLTVTLNDQKHCKIWERAQKQRLENRWSHDPHSREVSKEVQSCLWLFKCYFVLFHSWVFGAWNNFNEIGSIIVLTLLKFWEYFRMQSTWQNAGHRVESVCPLGAGLLHWLQGHHDNWSASSLDCLCRGVMTWEITLSYDLQLASAHDPTEMYLIYLYSLLSSHVSPRYMLFVHNVKILRIEPKMNTLFRIMCSKHIQT